MAKIGTVVIGVGTLGTIVFGVWLAISLDAYQVWDGWVIAAIVLWAIAHRDRAGAAGTSTSAPATGRASCRRPGRPGRAPSCAALNRTIDRVLLMHTVSSVAVLLVLIDMIWKPGA